jgi:hypothetical protein
VHDFVPVRKVPHLPQRVVRLRSTLRCGLPVAA